MGDHESPAELHPIIVVKRGGGHHDEHHGGVWKIAFADFMTAMMAFFLVMWLVNAANEETKVQVASYFNPIKLTDSKASAKQVHDTEPMSKKNATSDEHAAAGPVGSNAADSAPQEALSEDKTENADAVDQPYDEQSLFADPYSVLTEIAGQKGQGEPVSIVVPDSGKQAGLTGGEAFRDPFDPAYWQHGPGLVKVPKSQARLADDEFDIAEVDAFLGHGAGGDGAGGVEASKDMMNADSPGSGEAADADAHDGGKIQDSAGEEPGLAESREGEKADGEAAEKSASVSEDLARAIGDSGLAHGPQLSVEGTGEGVLVRLTDGSDFSMFSLASAKPGPETVRMMDKIAAALKQTKGKIIIRGHTDARPFRSKDYDNWRLSTARAHMAFYMLVRGGVDQSRIVRIEGRADRDPKNSEDPYAAENRRIEILIQDEAS